MEATKTPVRHQPTGAFRQGVGAVEVTRPFHFFLVELTRGDERNLCLLAVERPHHSRMVALLPKEDGICQIEVLSNQATFLTVADIYFTPEMVKLEEAISEFIASLEGTAQHQERAQLLVNIQFSLINKIINENWEKVSKPAEGWLFKLFQPKNPAH